MECVGESTQANNFTFFWETKSPFSQWHPSSFKLHGQTFSSAEQYMMYRKADLFDDGWAMKEIMATSNPREIKAWGRKVVGFDSKLWSHVAYDFVLRGNMAKFSQNFALGKTLVDTGDTIIVEAAPNDTVWGIGLDEATAIITPMEKWPGTNLLGLALMEVRSSLRFCVQTQS